MNYESPVFVSIVLYAIYALLAVAVSVAVWSAAKAVRHEAVSIKRPAGIVALLAVTMGATWLTASTKPLAVNGKPFTDAFWLRASDMLINTTIVLTAILLLAMLYALIRRRNTHV